jgi:uncharacterized protein (DUF1810 family)
VVYLSPDGRAWAERDGAQIYAITSRAEAVAYLQHALLGARLRECTELVNKVEGRSVLQIFDAIDALKLHSSMTLFAEIAAEVSVEIAIQSVSGNTLFKVALDKYFGGQVDQATLRCI